ncbi:hypothetical protein [Marivirga sp.]|uniref:hypothetical protein n=1 Tax=Marivirga sp. TaxID=2018662 RepID=UPI002D7F0C7D|nr:hypothetical protein [Marivirga sp.]HET8859382.1 hypothetical protein [Marivirga sp.]
MENQRLFYECKTARVYYYIKLKALFLEYTSKVKSDAEFIEINSEVLKAFQQLDCNQFVADIRRMGVISVASQQWIVKNLIPGLMKHLKGKPLFHAQLLDPVEVFAKVSAKNIKTKSAQEIPGFIVEQFYDTASLENYLSRHQMSA